jgi:predicted  nucleic acid-binding Zn-ribbon protein
MKNVFALLVTGMVVVCGCKNTTDPNTEKALAKIDDLAKKLDDVLNNQATVQKNQALLWDKMAEVESNSPNFKILDNIANFYATNSESISVACFKIQDERMMSQFQKLQTSLGPLDELQLKTMEDDIFEIHMKTEDIHSDVFEMQNDIESIKTKLGIIY